MQFGSAANRPKRGRALFLDAGVGDRVSRFRTEKVVNDSFAKGTQTSFPDWAAHFSRSSVCAKRNETQRTSRKEATLARFLKARSEGNDRFRISSTHYALSILCGQADWLVRVRFVVALPAILKFLFRKMPPGLIHFLISSKSHTEGHTYSILYTAKLLTAMIYFV